MTVDPGHRGLCGGGPVRYGPTNDDVAGRVTLTFGSLFAGVGGFDLGFERAGWECRWQVEWDKRCRSVLARHWPDVARYEDVRDVHDPEPVDLITYGFPCQDLSVAGKRAGLDGDRSGLFFEATRIIREMREATDGRYPTWAVAENVPGLLSADGGDAMGRCLDELADIGAVGIEWGVVDAQHLGLAQRRRRVFIVACFSAGGIGADPLLPLGQGRFRDPQPRAATGKDPAGTAAPRTLAVSQNQRGECVLTEYAHQLTTGGGKPGEGYAAVLIEREIDRERAAGVTGRAGRQPGAGWAPDRAAPVLSGEGRGYRNDVDGTTWVIQ